MTEITEQEETQQIRVLLEKKEKSEIIEIAIKLALLIGTISETIEDNVIDLLDLEVFIGNWLGGVE